MNVEVNGSLIYKQRLEPASEKLLNTFMSDLGRDKDTVLFDSKLKQLILKYGLGADRILDEIHFLNGLKSEDGFNFCQSIKQYTKLEVQLDRFTDPNYPTFRWNQYYQAALKWLEDQLMVAKLRPLTYCDDDSIRQALPKVDTHSGFTYFLTGKKEKGDNMVGIYQRFSEILDGAAKAGSFCRPILPGVRTQGSAYTEEGERLQFAKLKTRLVSMVDLMVIVEEMKYAKPFQNWMAGWNYYAGGKSPNEISQIISNDRSRYEHFISLDYSSFDQSLSDWLIEDVFSIIFKAFRTSDAVDTNLIVHDFIHKQFIGDHRVYNSHKGVPSGSMFTQIIDSLCNIVMIRTYLNSLGADGHMIVMGDDNLLFTHIAISSESVSSYLSRNFGVKVNGFKTSSGDRKDSPNFLSREWRFDGQWRHPNVLLSRMLFPERWRDYKSGNADPIEVFYAYILTYPIGMRELVDVDRFLFDNQLISNRGFDSGINRHLPGAIRFQREYLLEAD
jgi:hypothetical protein